MNKKLLSLCIIIFLSIPALTLIIKPGLYPSHDSLYHVERIEEFHSAIEYGQIPPRLAPNLLASIGYPLFIVNYQLPYYLAEIPMFFINDPTIAFKLVMGLGYLGGNILFLFALKNHFSPIASITGSIIFAYAPYRFANLYTRGAIGESTAIATAPLVLIALSKIRNNTKYSYVILALSTSILITSHTIVFIIFTPFFLGYSLFFLKLKKEQLLKSALYIGLGISISAFQLIPALFEKKFMVFDSSLKNLYQNHFISINQIFRIPQEGINYGTTMQLGIPLTLIFVLSFSIIKKEKKTLFFLSTFIASIFMITSLSQKIWQSFDTYLHILYPWRYFSLAFISIGYLSALFADKIKYKTVYCVFIIVITIITSRHYFLRPGQTEINLPTSNLTTQNENDTIWSNESTFDKNPQLNVSESAVILFSKISPFNIELKTQSENETSVVFRRLYFPGWTLKINGEVKNINIHNGLISTQIQPGTNLISLKFEESQLRKFANLTTIVSLLALATLTYRTTKQ